MRIWPIGSFIFFTSLWIISPSIANNKTQTDKVPVHLYMPDGQRSTRLVEVYLSEYINISMRPRLRLMSIAKKEKEPFIMDIDASTDFENEKIWFRPAEVIPGVAWKADEDKEMPKTGTLLLFDVPEEMEEFWRPGLRIRPILTWQSEGDSTWTNKATGRPIYLGNLVPAIIWPIFC